MSTKQCCGTCLYYSSVDDHWGKCQWRNFRKVPYCVARAYWWDVYPDQGEQCRCWRDKETTND